MSSDSHHVLVRQSNLIRVPIRSDYRCQHRELSDAKSKERTQKLSELTDNLQSTGRRNARNVAIPIADRTTSSFALATLQTTGMALDL